MLDLSLRSIRLTLHLLGVTVWVGGQITLLGLLPAARAAGTDLPKQFAQQFNKVAWPAFGLAVLTGLWNVGSLDMGNLASEYSVSLFLKLFLVAASGVGAFLHSRATTKAGLAIWGAVGLFGALLAVLVGVQLSVNTA